jgi:CxxC motif-containing protein (DUF1111 family)
MKKPRQSLLKLSLSASVVLSLVAATATSDAPLQFGDPLGGLTSSQLSAFNDGKTEFATAEEVDEGLGPVFNGRSCAECHSVPVIGGGSERLVTRFGTITNGVFDPLAQYGGSLIQDHAITRTDGSVHNFSPEQVPAAATIVAHRRTPPLFGLGLVDAVPDQTFYELAAAEARRGDGTAGRVAVVNNVATGSQSVGKFGWKNQVPSLFVFSGDAYLNEMGITNPLFPNENCPQGDCKQLKWNPRPDLNDLGDGVEAFDNFMTMLAAPPRGAKSADVEVGEEVFDQIGCTSCHTPTLHTGSSSIAPLDHATFHPYSDFLLHDMGSLGDGISQGDAGGRDMRTAPLWGLRMITKFLHDGRASSISDAILAHDGQGSAARDRFNALDANSKTKLLAFLNSL